MLFLRIYFTEKGIKKRNKLTLFLPVIKTKFLQTTKFQNTSVLCWCTLSRKCHIAWAASSLTPLDQLQGNWS